MNGSPHSDGDRLTIDELLRYFEPVKKVRNGVYVGNCRAHESKSKRSLSICIGHQGALLLRCWGGCTLEQILASVDLQAWQLFPEPLHDGVHSVKPRVSALLPVVATFERDCWIVALLAQDIGEGKTIAPGDIVIAKAAAARLIAVIKEARRVL